MAVIGAFLGGGSAQVPAGYGQLLCRWNTEDRQNIAGAVFTATPSSGSAVVGNGNATGYAELMVPAGTYSVSVQHSGTYLNDGPQQIVVESGQVYVLLFDAYIRPTVAVDSALSTTSTNPVQNAVVTSNINSINIALNGKLSTTGTAYAASRDGSGRVIVDTYVTRSEWQGSLESLKDFNWSISHGSQNDDGSWPTTSTIRYSVIAASALQGITAELDAKVSVTSRYQGSQGTHSTNVKIDISNSTLLSGQIEFSCDVDNSGNVYVSSSGTGKLTLSNGQVFQFQTG